MLVLLVSHISLSSKWNDVISFVLLLFNFVDHLVLHVYLIFINIKLANSLYHCLNYGFMRNKESWNLEKTYWRKHTYHGIDWQHICYAWQVYCLTDCAIPMGTICAPFLLTCFFIRTRHISSRASEEKWKEDRPTSNFKFRYIDYVLSLNDCNFGDIVDHFYHIELEIKDTKLGLLHTLTYTSN